ncbi:MAG TPA: hypothetical protein PLQ11_10905, partial [Beijerinckiaceae bacterium]|nr:hypothetical protein [Beijerinckiaceae bacterium]
AGSGRGGRGGGPGAFIERLKGDLGLTDDQKQAVDKILAELPARGGGQGRGMGGMGGMGGTGGGSGGGQARTQLLERIKPILNEQQQAKLTEIAEAGRSGRQRGAGQAVVTGRVYVLNEKGEATGQTVRLGASDGAFTEIISGLAAGASVVVGGGPSAARPASGFRFGM